MGLFDIIPVGAAAAAGTIARTVAERGIAIIVIVAAAFAVLWFLHHAIERTVRRALRPEHFASLEAERKREDTLIRILDGTTRVIVWFIAAFLVLVELGVSTTPFLTAAGTLGLAMSIGGQHFTRDVIAGACLIFEDQYRVGDQVTINTVTGTVVDITLRITVLADERGVRHTFPHGLITATANLSQHVTPPEAPAGPQPT